MQYWLPCKPTKFQQKSVLPSACHRHFIILVQQRVRHPHSYDHITLLNYDHISIIATSHMACHISWCPRFEKSQTTCVDAVLLHLDRIQNTHTEYSSCFQKKTFHICYWCKTFKVPDIFARGQSDKPAYATYTRGLPFGLIPNEWFQEW